MKCPVPYCSGEGTHAVRFIADAVCAEHKYLVDMTEDDLEMATQIAMIDTADSLRRLITLLEDVAVQQIKGRYAN